MNIALTVSDEAIELISKEGYDPLYGARPLRRAIQTMVEDELAETILQRQFKEGDSIRVDVEDGKIKMVGNGAAAEYEENK